MSRINFFDPERWSKEEPGFSAGVRYKGKNVFLIHQGKAEMEYGTDIDSNTRFHVASVSKQFPVYLIMVLYQAGKIDLDAPVQTYDSSFPTFEEPITVRHLIHHVSGLRDHWELFRMAGWCEADLKSMNQALRILYRQEKLNFQPGAEHIYSNTGYTILAHLIEVLSGKTMNEYAEEVIFKPLHMKHSFFREFNKVIIPSRTYSYELKRSGEYQKALLNYSIYGATSLFTTVEDLLLWGEHLLSLEETNRELYLLMTTDFTLNNGEPAQYAGGLIPDEFLGYSLFKHGGWDGGYRASFMICPELKAVSCCLSNNSTFKPEGYAKFYLKEHVPEMHDVADEFLAKLARLREETLPLSRAELCGLYSPAIGSYFVIREENNELLIKMPSMIELPLETHPEGGYWIKGTEMHFFFKRSAESQGAKLILVSVYPYDIQESPKVEIQPTGNTSEYCGTYYSSELECFHVISLKNNRLILSQIRIDDSVLHKMKGEDHSFVTVAPGDCIEGQIDFYLKDQVVAGYYLSRPRAKFVEFTKIS